MPTATPTSKQRCALATRAADYTIDQAWASYSQAEHDRWDRLFARSWAMLQGRACDAFLTAAGLLQLSQSGIPDMVNLSRRLDAATGWQVVPVAGLVPDAVFFDHLANRRFPAGAFIRSEQELDYLEEPDIFHDIFGHVPLLADPAYAAFMQAYGEGGRRALQRGQLHNLARLYWYTIEFGLMQSAAGLRIFGAGIMSSTAESKFALDDPSPHRVAFDLERVMRTTYIIDDFQKTYFVISNFQDLRAVCLNDFGALYDRLRDLPDIAPHQLIDSDQIVTQGSLQYFSNRARSTLSPHI
jgi:phenylalanine-4-hydroxylase